MKQGIYLLSDHWGPLHAPPWEGRVLSLGRGELCALHLPLEQVEVEHAELFWQGDQWWIRQKEGSVLVNGRPVKEVTLVPGDRIQLGEEGPVLLVSLSPSQGPSRAFSEEVAALENVISSLSTRLKILYSLLLLALIALIAGALFFSSPSSTTQLQQLERELQSLQQNFQKELGKRIAELERQLRQSRPIEKRFQEIQRKYEKSVVFIYTDIQLYHPATKKIDRLSSFGTGFAITPEGHIITNKHVVQPWKFGLDAERIAAFGYVVLEDTQRIALWPSGEQFLNSRGEFDFRRGFNNFHLQNLVISKAAEDLWIYKRTDRGKQYKVHKNNNHDLLLLRALGAKWQPIPLASVGKVVKLEPVMVLGYPQGMHIMPSGVVQTSPSLGTVRKVEEVIYISASVIPGSSGAPVFLANGRAIGICTRVYQKTETLGVCIQNRHIWQLLPLRWRNSPLFRSFTKSLVGQSSLQTQSKPKEQ